MGRLRTTWVEGVTRNGKNSLRESLGKSESLAVERGNVDCNHGRDTTGYVSLDSCLYKALQQRMTREKGRALTEQEHSGGRRDPASDTVEMLVGYLLAPDPTIVVELGNALGVGDEAVHSP